MPHRESTGLGHLRSGGCWELGCVWIGDGIFLWRWGKGLWHAPTRVSPALWSSCLSGCSYLGKGLFYLLLFLSFSSLLHLPLSLAFHLLRFCADLLGDLLALALSLHSFPTSPFQSTPIFFFFFSFFFFTFTPTLFPLLPPLHPTLFLSFSISSILPFQHMTDCVINVHHKPLFLLATH